MDEQTSGCHGIIRYEALEERAAALEAENTHLRAELDRLRGENDRLRKEQVDMRENRDHLMRERDAWEARVQQSGGRKLQYWPPDTGGRE